MTRPEWFGLPPAVIRMRERRLAAALLAAGVYRAEIMAMRDKAMREISEENQRQREARDAELAA